MSEAQSPQQNHTPFQGANIMNVETDICFKIIGAEDEVFHGLSKTLSTTDISFQTAQPLKQGMLLEMTMAPKQASSPSLQTMVEVTGIEMPEGSTSFHVDSSIKDIAIGI